MNRKIFLMMFFFLILFCGNIAYAQNQSIYDLTLKDSENRDFALSILKNSKLTVIVFFLADCPASQNYSLTINKLYKKYTGKNISFSIIFPDTYSSIEEIKKFKTDYKMAMPFLMDPDLKLTKMLKATVAPQCFLIDPAGTILYEGRIDDWYYKPGKKRTVILSNDLDNSISDFIEGKKIDPRRTVPVGCIINY